MTSIRFYILLGVGAWLSGLVAYTASLRLFYQQGMSLFELVGIAQLSGSVLAITYIPLVLFLQRRQMQMSPRRPLWLMPLLVIYFVVAPMILIWLKAGLITLAFGYGTALLTSDFFVSREAGLLYCLFGGASLVVAVGCLILDTKKKGDGKAEDF